MFSLLASPEAALVDRASSWKMLMKDLAAGLKAVEGVDLGAMAFCYAA